MTLATNSVGSSLILLDVLSVTIEHQLKHGGQDFKTMHSEFDFLYDDVVKVVMINDQGSNLICVLVFVFY